MPELLNIASIICLIPNFSFLPSFSFTQLLESLHFDHKFKSGRLTQLFGQSPYNYGTVLHNPSNFSDNRYVREIFEFVNQHFQSLHLNSCLINYYPGLQSSMPEHADDETCICENSFIVTISLGTSRRMFFRDSLKSESLCSVWLRDGSILLFPKQSQHRFTHAIPSVFDTDPYDYSPRISATFRKLK